MTIAQPPSGPTVIEALVALDRAEQAGTFVDAQPDLGDAARALTSAKSRNEPGRDQAIDRLLEVLGKLR
jgi:hypothetical protein